MPRVYEVREPACKECGERNPDEFFWVTRKSDGVRRQVKNRCKACTRAYNREDHRKNREVRLSRNLERQFGVTSEEYVAQLDKQGNRCATCGITRDEDIENRGRRWPVDHDHDTGAVRGILCWLCNIALGAARDRPDTLRAMAAYIESGGVW